MARPYGADSAATQLALLDAAEQQFSQLSYAGATNKSIADAVGLSTGSIYHYFGSKANLYAAVTQRALDNLARGFLEHLDRQATFKRRVQALAASAANLNKEFPHAAGLVANLRSEARQHPELVQVIAVAEQSIRQMFEAVVTQAHAHGELTHLSKDDMVDVFVAVTDGFARFAVGSDPAREARMLKTFAAMLDG